MAVFYQNICKFDACGQRFLSLSELITHIEECHIVGNAPVLDKKDMAMNVSWVLRLYSDGSQTSSGDSSNASSPTGIDSLTGCGLSEHPLHHHNHHMHHNGHHHNHHNHHRKSLNSPAVSLNTTPTGSEPDEDLDDISDQSIDGWPQVPVGNNFSKYRQMMNISSLDENNNSNGSSMANASLGVGNVAGKAFGNLCATSDAKIYHCIEPGCSKNYRSLNSLNHHRRSVHKAPQNHQPSKPVPVVDGEAKPRKVYRCEHCTKIYKTSHGLKNHVKLNHGLNKTQPEMINSLVAKTDSEFRPPLPSSIQIDELSINDNKKGSLNNKNELLSPTMAAAAFTAVTTMATNGNSDSNVGSPTVKESLNNIIRLKNSQQQQQQQQLSLNLNGASIGSIKMMKPMVGGLPKQQQQISPPAVTLASIPVTGNSSTVASANGINNDNSSSSEQEPKFAPLPMLAAPTLQQHLLSPIVPKVAGD